MTLTWSSYHHFSFPIIRMNIIIKVLKHRRIIVLPWHSIRNNLSCISLRLMEFGLFKLRLSWPISNKYQRFRGLMLFSRMVWIRWSGGVSRILLVWKKWEKPSLFHNHQQMIKQYLHQSPNLMMNVFSHKISPSFHHTCSFWTFIREFMCTRYLLISEPNNYSRSTYKIMEETTEYIFIKEAHYSSILTILMVAKL